LPPLSFHPLPGPYHADKLPPDLLAYADRHRAVGSRVTCDPAPTDTDLDILVFVPRGPVHRIMTSDGWTKEGFMARHPDSGDASYPSSFTSYRKGEVNAIITRNKKFYALFCLATELAKQFNLLSKMDRISLFQGVLYGAEG
jgi:hypothetical protein